MESEDVKRNINNFSRIPSWSCILTSNEVEEILDTCGEWIFCNGVIRTFVFEKLIDSRYKVTTKSK